MTTPDHAALRAIAAHARCSDAFNEDDEWVAGCCCGLAAPAGLSDKDGWHHAHVAEVLSALDQRTYSEQRADNALAVLLAVLRLAVVRGGGR